MKELVQGCRSACQGVAYLSWLSRVCAVLAVTFAATLAHAQTDNGVEPYEEFGKKLRAAEEITPLKSDLFGDKVSLYNGSTEFNVVDVSVPGNGALPVEFRRRLVIEDRRKDPGNIGGLGDWDLDVPYIEGTFTQQNGWVIDNNDSPDTARCTNQRLPYVRVSNLTYKPDASVIWDGNHLHIPGVADDELLKNTEAKLPAIADGNTYPWVTKGFVRLSCLGNTANGYPGQGFVAVTPSGVRYTFNWGVTRTAPTLKLGKNQLVTRSRIYLLATRIEDRFGNWVTYTYSGDQLTRIDASDGRAITIGWSGSTISSVTSAAGVWNYYYTAGALSTVRQPDASQWNYSTISGSMITVKGGFPDDYVPPNTHCQMEMDPNTGDFVYGVGAPSGAMGVFHFTYMRHYRNYIPLSCIDGNSYHLYPDVDAFFDNFALQSKQVTGAGLSTLNWTYDYGSVTGSYFTPSVPGPWPSGAESYVPQGTCSTCSVSKTVTVTGPDEITKYAFGVQYARNEGRLLQTEYDTASGTAVKTVSTTYVDDSEMAAQPFPENAGLSVLPSYKNPMVGRIRPTRSTTTVQDGDSYTWLAEAFDAFAQSTKIMRYNSIAGQTAVEEQITYLNDLPHWVIGLRTQLDNLTTGETVNKDVYDLTKVTLSQRWRFGQLVKSYAFNGQGLLTSFTDGNSYTTILGDYKGGIPRDITYQDNSHQRLEVDDMGRIIQVTDQLSAVTKYGYDSLGRMTRIDYPAGDEVAWYPKVYTYDYVTGAERGLGAGHWRRTMSKGNATTVTYFDAMLRPVLVDSSINGDGSSHSNVRSDYDWRGQKTFASYAVGGQPDLGAISSGTNSVYDILGRVTQVQQASELGTLTTTMEHLSGARTRITDPKQYVTTRTFQVFDQPSEDAVIQVVAPEGVTQTIVRDVYGNPLSITQSGLYGTESDSVTKALVYDSFHRLCRTIEPESGSEVTDYDGANNVKWTASGLTINGGGSVCGRDQVADAAKTVRNYDQLNRLWTILPPVGTQSTTYHYFATGPLQQADSGITTWIADRNKLGQLKSETLAVNGNGSSVIRYTHDAYGSTRMVGYPDGTVVDYAPDALGRPTQAGGYATNVSYFPDGDIQHFVYGNGAEYLAQKNARQLLSNFTYAKGSALNVSEDISYDGNGNIGSINDLAGGVRSKSFGYDGLNRLTNAQAPAMWGTETYTYDPINNLRTRLAAGQTYTYNYDATNRLANISQGSSPVVTLQYDNKGNVSNRNGATLHFDEKNQLLDIPGYDTYGYDASGRRVVRTPAGGQGSVYYFYTDAGQFLYQFDAATTKATAYIYLGKKLIARNESYNTTVRGYVDGVYVDGSNNAYVAGWACSSGIASSINVDLYVGGPAGSGIALGRYLANQSSEAAVASACGVGAGSFRFSIPLTAANRSQYVGQNIYVYGISPVGNGNPALTNSGNYVVPASPNAPPQPASLTATLAGDLTSISVTWAGSSGATSYTLQQNVSNGGWAPAYSGSGTSYVLSNPADGDYAYRVQACKSSDCSLFVISNTVSVRHIPLAPATISVPATSNGPLAVSWAASAYATSYTLEQSINGQAWAAIYSGSAISTSFSASATGSYTFRVKACNTNGCSTQYTTSSSVAVTIPPGSAPTLSSPSGSTTGSYTVSWTAVTGATYYNLQEQVGGNWSTVQSNSATSWGASGRGNGTYGYRVQACNAGGCSGWSGVSSTTILLPPSPAPSISAPGSNTTGSYGISWNSNATATYYQLWQLNPGSGWAVVQSTGATSWSVSGKTSGNYQYYVTACNASGCSAASATATVTVLLPPASAPSPSVPSNSTNGSYTVSWNAVTDGASYTLQESVNGGGWATVQANGATAWSTGGRGNASYGYRVQACNASGCGPWSGTATVTVLLPPPAPAWVQAPSYVHGQQYYITWASSSTATSYNVIRKNLDNGNTAVYTSTSATTVTIPIPGATQSIQWGAQACNASGCSGTTNAPNITNTDPPGPIN